MLIMLQNGAYIIIFIVYLPYQLGYLAASLLSFWNFVSVSSLLLLYLLLIDFVCVVRNSELDWDYINLHWLLYTKCDCSWILCILEELGTNK